MRPRDSHVDRLHNAIELNIYILFSLVKHSAYYVLWCACRELKREIERSNIYSCNRYIALEVYTIYKSIDGCSLFSSRLPQDFQRNATLSSRFPPHFLQILLTWTGMPFADPPDCYIAADFVAAAIFALKHLRERWAYERAI